MASGVIFLTGPPSEHELARRAPSPANVLPEFQTEELSLQRSWTAKTDGKSLPVWTAIAPARTTDNQHISGNKQKGVKTGTAGFPESQIFLANANPTQALSGAEASVIGSDLQSFLDTSFRLHELDINLSLPVAEQRAHRLGLESHAHKMCQIEITHLEHVPTAAHLRDIEPQTMTVNLIVGIISSPKARSVYTAVERRRLSLLELVVGDETKSGFGINIWLPQDKDTNEPLMQEAHALRQGQLVLFQNVALNSFRGRVYGQNLRRNLTQFASIHGECDGQKVRAVRNWIAEFVALGEPGSRTGTNRSVQLPPDTQ